MIRVPDVTVLAAAQRLDDVLALPFPPRHIDPVGHDGAMARLRVTILGDGGTFTDAWNGTRIRHHGFSATSTSGLVKATRNWITQVRGKATPA